MVHREQGHVVVLTETDQTRTDQRPVGEIEGRRGFLGLERGELCFGVGSIAQVVQHERQAGRGIEEPDLGSPVAGEEHRAQRLVAGEQRIEAALPGGDVERPAQPARGRDVVDAARSLELGEEPQPLLGEGQRERRSARDGNDRCERVALLLRDGCGELGQRRMREQRRQRHAHRELGLHAAQQAHGEQRMAAELEEVVVAADRLDAEQLAPDRGQGLFDLALAAARRRWRA